MYMKRQLGKLLWLLNTCVHDMRCLLWLRCASTLLLLDSIWFLLGSTQFDPLKVFPYRGKVVKERCVLGEFVTLAPPLKQYSDDILTTSIILNGVSIGECRL